MCFYFVKVVAKEECMTTKVFWCHAKRTCAIAWTTPVQVVIFLVPSVDPTNVDMNADKIGSGYLIAWN